MLVTGGGGLPDVGLGEEVGVHVDEPGVMNVRACRINSAPAAALRWWLGSWRVPQNFVYPQRDRPLLMLVDMWVWLPEDDLVFVVLDAVAAVGLGEFRRRHRGDGHGRAAFDPEMMAALLL
jgi:hypothetical protein